MVLVVILVGWCVVGVVGRCWWFGRRFLVSWWFWICGGLWLCSGLMF